MRTRVINVLFKYQHIFTGTARCIRIDGGTENVLIADIQNGLIPEDCDHAAVIVGSSHGNQVCFILVQS